MGKWATTLAIGIAATVIALAHPDQAAAATAINGRCGVHLGGLIQRNSSGSEYHARIGPKYLGRVVPSTCRGQVRVKRTGAAGQAGALAWQTYQLTNWNEKTVILVAGGYATATTCYVVGQAVAAAIAAAATDGIAYPGAVAVGGAVGCGVGIHELWSYLPDGPSTVNDVRMVK